MATGSACTSTVAAPLRLLEVSASSDRDAFPSLSANALIALARSLDDNLPPIEIGILQHTGN